MNKTKRDSDCTGRSTARTVGLVTCLMLVGGLIASPAAYAVDPLGDATCPDNLNSCTSNDVKTSVVSALEIGGDDCADGSLDVQWTFEFETTANQRYDLGVFISKDGGTVQEPSSALSCAGAAALVGDGDPNSNPDGDNDLFQDLDGPQHDGLDTCGDLSTAEGPVQWTVSATVACTDVTPQGALTIPSCRVWEQNANHSGNCTDLSSAGTGSKCDCNPVVLQVDPCLLIICDDGNVCNGEETCDSSSGTAVCTDGTPLVCDDGEFCNGTETCDPTSGCQDGPDPVCDNGLFCDGMEVCNETDDRCDSLGRDCDNGLWCDGDEICNEGTDSCDSQGRDCDNGLWCDGDEICNEGTDSCDSQGRDCDNGLWCDGDEICNEGTDSCDSQGRDCDNGLWCDGDEICNEDTDSCDSQGRDCDNGLWCDGDETCNEDTDSCDSQGDPCLGTECNTCQEDTDSCFDPPGTPCTGGVCDGQGVCPPLGDDACRTAGFWGNHPEATSSLFEVTGGFEICGYQISDFECGVEGLCNRPKGDKQAIAARHLLTAALNCATNGSADCSASDIADLFNQCNEACIANNKRGMSMCSPQLDCYNNGGMWDNGRCALGTCSLDSTELCGASYGDCDVDSGDCVNFPGNCHDNPLPDTIPQGSTDPASCQTAYASSEDIFDCGLEVP